MQTFLPYPNFEESANCLDWQGGHNRLNNQINEAMVITKTLLGHYKKGWRNHPAVLMWKGYELALLEYMQVNIQVWKWRKGLEWDNREKIHEELFVEVMNTCPSSYCRTKIGNYETNYPWWLGFEKFHSSHRSILLAKNPNWYGQFDWTEEPAVRNHKNKWPYYWPVTNFTKEGENNV